MKIFKNKWFARFARQENISDRDLCDAVARAERGLIDAALGGGVIKQRIARRGEGKSGGFRSIIYFRAGERAFFVFGFSKNQLDNVSAADLKLFKQAARLTLNLTEVDLQRALAVGKLLEVIDDEKNL